MASHTESSLISKLESSTSIPIFSLFSDFLLPFANLKDFKKPKSQSQTLIRSLAKQFLPFINRSLSILPKRLSDPSKLPADGKATPRLALELFDIYRLCLDCLELVSSQLSCKPYAVHVQRVRLVYCLETWGLYREAESEGFGLLEKLRGLDFGAKKKTSKKTLGEFIPDAVEVGDAEFARLVVETVIAIVKCVVLRQSKSGGDYRRVIVLVEEVKPWFRELDANTYEKLHRVLVTYLGKCTLSLVGDPSNFEQDMLRAFCMTTLSEYGNSSLKDQTYKFARHVCSSLFLLQDDRSSLVIDLLMCVLDCLASKCKIESEKWETEFVELVSYCANKCRTARTISYSTVAELLNNLADDLCQAMTPMSLILRLYSFGLYIGNCVFKSMVDDALLSKDSKDEHAVNILLGGAVKLGSLANLLSSLQDYVCGSCVGSCGAKYEDSANNLCPASDSHSENFLICIQGKRKVHLLAYYNVLKFVCQPLAELVNSGKKQILAENDVSSVSCMLCDIQEAFYQFCDIFLLIHSSTFQMEVDGLDDNRMVPSAAVAAFTISIITKLRSQKIRHLVKQIIGSGWIHRQGLKYVYASLYNVGILLYRKKQVIEASESLKLCCRASWVCLLRLCQRFVHKQNEFVGELSEDTILELAAEACARTAFLLDVLYQCGSHKMEKVIVNSLENWSVAEDLFRRLPGPMALVKQWVKIECKLNTNTDVENKTPTLHSLLSSSVKVSKRAIGRILQQELLAYEEMDTMYPEYCRQMQIKTIDILLQDVYISKDCFLSKSRILLKKGRILRTCGFEGLNNCIQCCSEAISTIRGVACIQGTPASHQLAVAYCLRALLAQEAEPNSKQVFQDIKAALNLWLSIPISDYDIPCDDNSVLCGDSMMFLLYNAVDLLSMKGYVELHHDKYKLMFRLFKWKSVPAEKCLSILWESRRLSHALCMSPINDALIMNLAEEYGDKFKFVEFWINCLKESLPSLVGFLQNFSYLFTRFLCGPHKDETYIQSDVTVDDIKKAASDLISSVPVTSHSVFFAGYLYYDLCERLITTGHLFEALSCAKEAHRLRTKLFQENFTYSVEQQVEKSTEGGGHNQKLTYSIQNLQMCRSIASEALSFETISWDFEAFHLSPWKVLQCYLESTLQVGMIHEMLGNGAEAETLFLWGKGISCSQSLPLFTVSFSSVLGKLYRKKWSWDLSEKELQSAKQTLVDSCMGFACLKCRLVLDVTIDQQLGDLYRSHAFSASGSLLIERVSLAESLYKSALDKLNLSEWRNSVSCPEIVESVAKNSVAYSATTLPDAMRGPKEKKEARKGRKTKNTPRSLSEEQFSAPEHNARLTRSRYLSSQSQNIKNSANVQNCISKHLKGNNVCGLPDNGSQKRSLLEKKSCMVDLGYESTCICNNMKCWFCLVMEVRESGLVINFLHMKWELFRRRLSVRIFNGIGKCLGARGQVHEMHEIILQSISVLVGRNPLNFAYAPLPLTFLLDLVEKELSMDVFAIERAAILYNICWFFLKSYRSKDTRSPCCDLYHVQIQKVVSWLMLAFVVSREVPILFQKISRLLSAIYLLSSFSDVFSLPSVCKVLSQSHWASYFHQASLGTQFNYQFFSNMTGKIKPQHQVGDEGTHLTGLTSIQAETCKLPRLAPESVQDLKQLVIDFFSALPCTTIICISLIGGLYASLLQELLMYPSSVHAWMLVSRLNDKNQPVVMLLPVDALPEEASEVDGENPDSGKFLESNCLDRHWHCPWGFTTVDHLAPAFKIILEENYLSSLILPSEDTKRNRTLWWMRRKKLDCQLGQLLRDMEDSWFGPLRYVLLGGWPEYKKLDMVLNKLLRNLKSKCKMEVNESFLKIILGGRESVLDIEACISHLLRIRKGCLIGKAAHCDEAKCNTLPKEYEGAAKLSGLAIQLLHDAVNELEDEETANREPVILVLDYEVQMLPWENLPMLRNQEVYRMPSVGSICLALDRTAHRQEQAERITVAFPFIDPLDAFYLLNPSGDLSGTQIEFENWFKSQNLEGKAGSAPTAEELASALKSHDLFIYFGHGSGVQYISRQEIQKLETCAATLLMGCSSGSLSLNGCYIPQGTPLSYLTAGSPAIIANLWEVTDKDIDRFGKSMLNAWLKERSSSSIGCIRCNLVEEFEAMNIRGGKVNVKKKFPKKVSEASEKSSLKDCCDHRPKIGSFMGQAREACTLPFLIGASPVCYGVPTGIRRKRDLQHNRVI